MGQTIVRVAVFAVFAAWIGLMAWTLVQPSLSPWKPDVPLYPGAKQARTVIEAEWLGAPAFPHQYFVTQDRPLQVELFYIRELENRGWHWEKNCNFFYHTGYLAFVHTTTDGAGLTNVRISIEEGRLSCDGPA